MCFGLATMISLKVRVKIMSDSLRLILARAVGDFIE